MKAANTSRLHLAPLRLRPLCGGAVEIFGHAKLHDLGDQVQGQRLVFRKLHRALGAFVTRYFLLKCRDSARCRIESDVMLEGRKIDEIALLGECGHTVADAFLRVRRCSVYGGTYSLE